MNYLYCKSCGKTYFSSDKKKALPHTKRCKNIANLKLIYGESFPTTNNDIDHIKNEYRYKYALNDNEPIETRIYGAVEVIRAYFARSITQGDASGKGHPDFLEYLQAYLFNETTKPAFMDKELLTEMINRFGKKKSKLLKSGRTYWDIYQNN